MNGAPSGQQFELQYVDQRATVVEVGAGIRTYRVGQRDVLDPYPEAAICDGGHGAVLIPWPNRVADGRYRFDGVDYQLPLEDPGNHAAIHGLLRWRPWSCLERDPDRVVLGVRLHPTPGYPFALDARIEYALGVEGLAVTTTAVNVGSTDCPYATGQHPYLSPGTGPVDAATLTLDARTWIDTDTPNRVPGGCHPVAGSELDFRVGRAIGPQRIDTPFSDLSRDAEGRATARLTGADAATVELWADSTYSVLQIFTGDTLRPDRRRLGLACEPMTAPPNALATGDGLIRLAPGERTVARWGVRLH